MPTTIDSAGITFNDATTLTSANIGTAQLVNGSVTAAKLGTTEQTRIVKAWIKLNAATTPVTINSSYNVSSVTKSSGFVTINFTTAMSDANYSVVATAESVNVGISPSWAALGIMTNSSATIYMQPTAGGTLGLSPQMSMVVFAN